MGQDYLTDSQLKAIMPLCNAEKRKIFTPYLNLSMAYFRINTELRVSMYLAHLAHESTDLTPWVENLNYSASRLTQVWSRRFPTLEAAAPYAHNPKALANKVYNGRMGNRIGTNDGFLYRGRAPLQATGRDMYAKLTESIGRDFNVDFVANPDLLLTVQYCFLSSAWIFAVEKNCLPLADRRDLEGTTRRINGGTNGLKDRLQNYRTALAVLPDSFNLKSYAQFQTEMFGSERVIANASKANNQSRLTVTNQDLIHLDIPTTSAAPADNSPQDGPSDVPSENFSSDSPAIVEKQGEASVSPASVPPSNTETKVEITDGNVRVETKENPGEPDKIAVEKPEPKNFIEKMWKKITGVFGGGAVTDVTTEKLAQVNALGLSYDFWKRIVYFAVAAGVIYLIVELVHHYQEVKRDKEITNELVKANSTESNKVVLVDKDNIEYFKARGYRIVYR